MCCLQQLPTCCLQRLPIETISLSLSLTLSHAHKHTHARTHTRSFSLALSLSLFLSHTSFPPGNTQGFADGVGTAGKFNCPWGLAVDGHGSLYVADHGNNCIRKVVAVCCSVLQCVATYHSVMQCAGHPLRRGPRQELHPQVQKISKSQCCSDFITSSGVANLTYENFQITVADGGAVEVATVNMLKSQRFSDEILFYTFH